MRATVVVLAIAGVSAVALGAAFGRQDVELKVGEQAPAFALTGSDGKPHALAEYRGKQVVVLAWFPKAFTGG